MGRRDEREPESEDPSWRETYSRDDLWPFSLYAGFAHDLYGIRRKTPRWLRPVLLIWVAALSPASAIIALGPNFTAPTRMVSGAFFGASLLVWVVLALRFGPKPDFKTPLVPRIVLGIVLWSLWAVAAYVFYVVHFR